MLQAHTHVLVYTKCNICFIHIYSLKQNTLAPKPSNSACNQTPPNPLQVEPTYWWIFLAQPEPSKGDQRCAPVNFGGLSEARRGCTTVGFRMLYRSKKHYFWFWGETGSDILKGILRAGEASENQEEWIFFASEAF